MKVITPQGNLGGFTVLSKTPEGTCPECAVKHDPEQPHNRDSLAYQYKFLERMGSWPTWADAMAHCPEHVREVWTIELKSMRVDIGTVTPDRTKALSIRQPWAWLIVNGHKDIENRTWKTHYRGRVLIHASKGMTRDDYLACELFCSDIPGVELPAFKDLDRGGIVGEAVIADCVSKSDSPWFTGEVGFVMANAKPLPFQPCKGALGFFNPDLTRA